jgi:signal transduction histidine kinase
LIFGGIQCAQWEGIDCHTKLNSMTSSPIAHPSPLRRPAWGVDRLFNAASKDTVIRLRWPLVILSSYLLYYAPSIWLTATQVQAILILYLLSHSTLYFLADDLFDSPYFYGPLLLFDTIVLLAVLSTSGTASPDFYAACLFTLVISCICNDARGLLAVTFLAPLVYGYFVFYSVGEIDPAIYLRLPFPFVISLFYGYFAQVERIRRKAREKDDQATQQQQTAEETRRQRERLEVLHQINVAITSTIDSARLLDSLLTTALVYLPYAAALVRLKTRGTGAMETAAARGFQDKQLIGAADALEFMDRAATQGQVVAAANVFRDPMIDNAKFFELEGLSSFIGVPLVANNDTLGYLVFFGREAHEFSEAEIDFLSTLAGQAAIAIHHAELYQQSQRQAEELRGAHKVKDEFLRAVSTQLKTPLNVITGYAGMFLEGLLGGMTPLQEKGMETVARQSKELHGLINTVLQVSNIETEPLHLELRELDVWDFLSELRASYDSPMGADLRLVWDYPQDFPSVQADRLKLRHIIENLIDNAIKFTERGTVTISARYLNSRKALEFKVSDTGVGIAEEQIPTIFQRFRRGGETSAGAPRSGIGLGLYVVKKYLELLGGEIRVESGAGRGSTFTVRIPAPLKQSYAPHEQLLLPTETESLLAAPR